MDEWKGKTNISYAHWNNVDIIGTIEKLFIRVKSIEFLVYICVIVDSFYLFIFSIATNNTKQKFNKSIFEHCGN